MGEARIGGGGALEVGKGGLGRVPDLDRVGVVADKFLEVCGQGAPVGLEAVGCGRGGRRGPDALGDVKDDAGEAVLVDVDFLVVGDFAEFAARWVSWPVLLVSSSVRFVGGKAGLELGLYLTSANFSGRSQMREPPKRGVVL